MAPAEPEKCQILDNIDLDPSGGYIGKQTLEGSAAYLSDCIWSLNVNPGQKISFIFYSFLYGQTKQHKEITANAGEYFFLKGIFFS